MTTYLPAQHMENCLRAGWLAERKEAMLTTLRTRLAEQGLTVGEPIGLCNTSKKSNGFAGWSGFWAQAPESATAFRVLCFIEGTYQPTKNEQFITGYLLALAPVEDLLDLPREKRMLTCVKFYGHSQPGAKVPKDVTEDAWLEAVLETYQGQVAVAEKVQVAQFVADLSAALCP